MFEHVHRGPWPPRAREMRGPAWTGRPLFAPYQITGTAQKERMTTFLFWERPGRRHPLGGLWGGLPAIFLSVATHSEGGPLVMRATRRISIGRLVT